MYQKEIIYVGLYKGESRIGSAGFLKVENRGRESRMYLKIQNVPLGISGRFPIRIYNGSDWKELSSVAVQDGGGYWEETVPENVEKSILLVSLSGGYTLEGRSKSAPDISAQKKRDAVNVSNERVLQGEEQNIVEYITCDTEQNLAQAASQVVEWNAAQSAALDAERNIEDPTARGSERNTAHIIEQGAALNIARNAEQNVTHPITLGAERSVTQPMAQDREYNLVQNIAQDRELNAEQHTAQDLARNALRSNTPAPQQRTGKRTDKTQETIIVKEELPRRSSGNIDIMPQRMSGCNLKEDKWEQILDIYEQIHPYGDDRVYVKLEPKDFVILQAKYQHLVNNSFLLHGFYNYRYVILGKEHSFYLGVPGVFYEREKMVAQMFGFEAFECPGGNVKAGEFGYYLRKVEL